MIANPFENKNLKLLVYDIETYPNHFLVKFLGKNNQIYSFTGANLDHLRCFINDANLFLIGFNNLFFDDLLLKYIIHNNNATTKEIYDLADKIIKMGDKKSKLYWDIWGLNISWWRSIDVYKLPKPTGGLKVRGCALHAPTIKDLPIPPGTVLTILQKIEIFKYCDNDLKTTLLVYNNVLGDIKNRLELEKMYPGTDLISKHDAGVCETIMTHEYCRRNNLKPYDLKRTIPKPGQKINLADTIPTWCEFNDPALNELLLKIKRKTGIFSSVDDKKQLTHNFTFAGVNYQFGAGGLHSEDNALILEADDDHYLIDVDVDSFYPGLIRALDIRPAHLNNVYNDIVNEQTVNRLNAKYSGDKAKAQALKIPILSNFGKTGSPYSVMFGELAQLQVTIGGQLSLLMLIEILVGMGFKVLSANTDGIFLKIKKTSLGCLRSGCALWEKITSQKLSETYYKKYIRRDINNYLAIDMNGEVVKEKGIFKKEIKGKANIISKAVADFFSKGTPVEKTITMHPYIIDFLFYFHCTHDFSLYHTRVDNDRVHLQKTNRWYISNTNVKRGELIKWGKMTDFEISRWKLTHKLDNHPNNWLKYERLANGFNSVICENLPTSPTLDIDYNHYIQAAKEIIYSVAAKTSKFKKKMKS